MLTKYLKENENKLTAEDLNKLKGDDGQFDPSRLSEKDNDEMFKRLGQQNGSKGNEMWGTSFGDGILGSANSFLTGVANDFTNMFTAGSGNITSSAGMVDENGVFHPRTCFVAGTLVVRLKADFREKGASAFKAGSLSASLALGKSPQLKNQGSLETESVPIEQIQVGDYVASYNEKTGRKEYKKVTELYYHKVKLLYRLELGTGDIIETTWNHPFYVVRQEKENASTVHRGGWTEARYLKAGDVFLTASGKYVSLKSSRQEHSSKAIPVYNFEVEDNHSYYVGHDGILVHNYDVWPMGNQGYMYTASQSAQEKCGNDQNCMNKEMEKAREKVNKLNADEAKIAATGIITVAAGAGAGTACLASYACTLLVIQSYYVYGPRVAGYIGEFIAAEAAPFGITQPVKKFVPKTLEQIEKMSAKEAAEAWQALREIAKNKEILKTLSPTEIGQLYNNKGHLFEQAGREFLNLTKNTEKQSVKLKDKVVHFVADIKSDGAIGDFKDNLGKVKFNDQIKAIIETAKKTKEQIRLIISPDSKVPDKLRQEIKDQKGIIQVFDPIKKTLEDYKP